MNNINIRDYMDQWQYKLGGRNNKEQALCSATAVNRYKQGRAMAQGISRVYRRREEHLRALLSLFKVAQC